MTAAKPPAIDPILFRDTLGHFPTGVVVVTAIVDGSPIGMVVGSFTSVSLDPPLVAFLPSRTSSTYRMLKLATRFCVNVLADEQENICRRFASKIAEKFDGIDWYLSASGVPRLRGSVGWIEFEAVQVVQAGDHDIVIGRVCDLASDADQSPLLFFQGGYGGFRSRSRVIPFESDLRTQLRYADIARGSMERLSDDLGFECFAQARVDDQLIVVAGVGGTDGLRTQIGRKAPFVPPYGTVFIANNSGDKMPVNRPNLLAGPADSFDRYQEMLARVRDRGWSIVLNAPANDRIWSAIHERISIAPTPDAHAEMSGLIEHILPSYEPEEIKPAAIYNPRMLIAPVYRGEQVVLSISLYGLEQGVPGEHILEWAARLQQTATETSQAISREMR